MYLFSKSDMAFYPKSELAAYEEAGTLPDDVVEVSDVVRDEYNFMPPAGKKLGVNSNGKPAWVNRTKEELTEGAEIQKLTLIAQANTYINNKQWPGKAAMNRLKDDEKEKYGLWLDYLDALEAADTSALDIKWPAQPV